MSIGRAYTPDVTRQNDAKLIYVEGNEFLDGSVRLEGADAHTNNPHFEFRAEGIWANTGLLLGADTLFLGTDVSLSGVGSHVQVESVERNTKSLPLEVIYDDAGTKVPHTPIIGPYQTRVVFSANTVGEIVTSLLELQVTSFVTALRFIYYFKTGSVAATSTVTMTLSKGFAPGGAVVFSQTMPASQWPANTEVQVVLRGAITLTVGAPLLLTIESDNDFSLIGDEANGGNFFAMDFQLFTLEDVIAIPSGTNRFIATNDGKIMVDNSGHPLMSGTSGSLSQATPPPAQDPPVFDPPPTGL